MVSDGIRFTMVLIYLTSVVFVFHAICVFSKFLFRISPEICVPEPICVTAKSANVVTVMRVGASGYYLQNGSE